MKYKPDVPHDDEITWDAHDRVVERLLRITEERNMDYDEKDRSVYVFVGLLIIGILLLVGFLILKQDASPVVNQYELNGVTYTCEHYDDGGMECWDTNDPDVGFGKIGG